MRATPPRRSGRHSFATELFAAVVLLVSMAACGGPPNDPPGHSAPTAVAEPIDTPAPWPRIEPVQAVPEDRPLRAAFLLVDGVYNTELVAPFDVLEHVRYYREPGIEVFTVSADGGPVTTAEGLVIQADTSFEQAPDADILVVASAEHSKDSDLENRALIEWVGAAGRSARHVLSLCWGAFVLGEAGLLEGRSATTFPRDFDAFAERFTTTEVRRGPTLVHDGPVITSEGGVRSFDAAMYLVDHLYGTEIATRIGDGLLIDWPRFEDAPIGVPHLVQP